MVGIDPITSITNLFSEVIDKVWPDRSQSDLVKLKLLEMQQSGELQTLIDQLDINKEEAKSNNLFVAGWRPFVGWVCALSCSWNWVILPILKSILSIVGHPIVINAADLGEMLPMLMGLLGLGGLHTYEKLNGIVDEKSYKNS